MSLRLEGFGSYREECILDLSGVRDCVVLGPNGSGKSTMFRAMLWAMYGETGDVKADEVVHPEAETAVVEYTFTDFNGDPHTFTRTRSVKGSGKSTATWTGPGGSVEKAREVAEQAQSILNCDVGLLTLTAIARQGEVGAFASMSTAERREQLSGVILGEVFDGSYESAADYQVGVAAAAQEAAAKFSEVERAGAGLEAAEAEEKFLRDKTTEAEAERDRIADLIRSSSPDAVRAAKATLARLAATRKDMEDAKRSLERAKKEKEGHSKAATSSADDAIKLDAAVVKAETMADKAEADAEMAEESTKEAAERAAEAAGRASGMNERLTGLAAKGRGQAECWTCGQPLTAKQRGDLVKEAKRLIADASKKRDDAATTKDNSRQAAKRAKKLRGDVSEKQTKAAESSRATEEHERAVESLAAQIKQFEESIAKLEDALVDLDGEAEDARRVIKQAEDVPTESQLRQAEDGFQESIRAHEGAKLAVGRCRAARAELPALADAKAKTAREMRVAELAKNAFRPSGVPHTALRSRLTDFQSACNDALANLGGLRMEIDAPLSEKRQQELNIMGGRWDRDGGLRRYEALSGGERMRLDLALRIGLCRVSNVKSRTLLLDEGWGALDSEGTASLAHMLRNLIDTGEMESIYTITHSEAASDAFSHRIIVARDSSGSSSARLEKV